MLRPSPLLLTILLLTLLPTPLQSYIPHYTRTSFLRTTLSPLSLPIALLPPSASSAAGMPRYRESELEMQFSDLPRTRGVIMRRYTGESTPYTFKKVPIKTGRNLWFWKIDKFSDAFSVTDFSRADEHKDEEFYIVPRFVYHIDEGAVSALTNYYKTSIKDNSDVLDICSSWVSHYPIDFPEKMKSISAIGLNEMELKANDQLTGGYKVVNLNPVWSTGKPDEIKIPYPDDSFDVVTCVVSIDYLNRPLEVLSEVKRVLRSGGKVIISQSNRCFPSKAVNMWLSMTDLERLELIEGYLMYSGGWDKADVWDVTAKGGDARDPMFVVESRVRKG